MKIWRKIKRKLTPEPAKVYRVGPLYLAYRTHKTLRHTWMDTEMVEPRILDRIEFLVAWERKECKGWDKKLEAGAEKWFQEETRKEAIRASRLYNVYAREAVKS